MNNVRLLDGRGPPRPVFVRENRELPLYHTPHLFVKGFAKNFSKKIFPKTLDICAPVWYNG